MIDSHDPAASWFLWIASVTFLVVFALPLLVAPLWWARRFLWQVTEPNHLAVYLGRCLGSVAVAIGCVAIHAATRPRDHVIVFELVGIAGALLTCVHAWGALRREQPWTETAEIALYSVLSVLAWSFWYGLRT